MLKELGQVLHGPMLRAIAGIRDAGETLLAFFSNPDGGSVYEVDPDDNADVWVSLQSAIEETPTGKITARLFIPMNMLYRLPRAGESAVVLRGKDADGPGKPIALYGDGGADANGTKTKVPNWLSSSLAGISLPEGFQIESTGDKVKLVANSGGTSAVLELEKGGKVTITAAAGQDIVVKASGAGAVQLDATPVTGAIKLGPVGTLAVLVQGASDSLGVPVTQAPAAALTIVKAG